MSLSRAVHASPACHAQRPMVCCGFQPSCRGARRRGGTLGLPCPPAFSPDTARPWPTCLPLCLVSELPKQRPISPNAQAWVSSPPPSTPGHPTHVDRARLRPKPSLGLPGCMQTLGFHILAYQGQDSKTQGQFWGRRCQIMFCLIEGWTRELSLSTSIRCSLIQ